MRKNHFVFLILALMLAFSPVLAKNEDRAGNVAEGQEETADDVAVVISTEDSAEGVVVSTQKDYLDARRAVIAGEIERYREARKELMKNATEELRALIEQERRQLKEELKTQYQNLDNETKARIQAQKRMNLFVHSLLELREINKMEGGIGEQVSELAGGFNKSAERVMKIEEKLQTRSGFAKFLLGNRGLAKKIKAEMKNNEEGLARLEEVLATCNCDETSKALIQEQVQEMKQEQERLNQIAEKESKKTGLLGWLF
jgi:DNA-binding transcriptional regulator GbsR (MarR family)